MVDGQLVNRNFRGISWKTMNYIMGCGNFDILLLAQHFNLPLVLAASLKLKENDKTPEEHLIDIIVKPEEYKYWKNIYN